MYQPGAVESKKKDSGTPGMGGFIGPVMGLMMVLVLAETLPSLLIRDDDISHPLYMNDEPYQPNIIPQIMAIMVPLMLIGMMAPMIRSVAGGSSPVHAHIAFEDKVNLTRKYGAWAVGLAESFCPENDLACVEAQARKLLETRSERPYHGVAYGTRGQTLEKDDFQYLPSINTLRQWAIVIAKQAYGKEGGYGPGLKMPVDSMVVTGPSGLRQKWSVWDLFK